MGLLQYFPIYLANTFNIPSELHSPELSIITYLLKSVIHRSNLLIRYVRNVKQHTANNAYTTTSELKKGVCNSKCKKCTN